MGLPMDFSGIGNAADLQSGGDRPKPGRGMVVVTKWSEYTGKYSEHEMEVEIVAWSDPDSVTMTYTARIKTKDNSGKGHPAKVMAALGVAGGLFTPADIERWKEEEASPDIDFNDIVGRAMMLHLVEEPDQNDKAKIWLNVGSFGKGFYHIRDPRVKDWPTNQGVYNANAAKVGDYVLPDDHSKTPAAATTTAPVSTSNPFGNA